MLLNQSINQSAVCAPLQHGCMLLNQSINQLCVCAPLQPGCMLLNQSINQLCVCAPLQPGCMLLNQSINQLSVCAPLQPGCIRLEQLKSSRSPPVAPGCLCLNLPGQSRGNPTRHCPSHLILVVPRSCRRHLRAQSRRSGVRSSCLRHSQLYLRPDHPIVSLPSHRRSPGGAKHCNRKRMGNQQYLSWKQ